MFEKVTEHIYVYPCDGYTDRPNIGLIIGSKYTLLGCWEREDSRWSCLRFYQSYLPPYLSL